MQSTCRHCKEPLVADDHKLPCPKCGKLQSSTLINNDQLLLGFYMALEDGDYFFKTSKMLFENKDFQACVPLTTIAIEESLKGLEILKKFRKRQDISEDDWKNLKNHQHKLTHSFVDAIEEMKKERSQQEIAAVKQEIEKTGVKIPDVSFESLIKSLETRTYTYSHFQDLRESSFYVDWDDVRENFSYFNELDKETQENMSFYMLAEAEITLNFLRVSIE
jgi:AbiV family abortive infection protein